METRACPEVPRGADYMESNVRVKGPQRRLERCQECGDERAGRAQSKWTPNFLLLFEESLIITPQIYIKINKQKKKKTRKGASEKANLWPFQLSPDCVSTHNHISFHFHISFSPTGKVGKIAWMSGLKLTRHDGRGVLEKT